MGKNGAIPDPRSRNWEYRSITLEVGGQTPGKYVRTFLLLLDAKLKSSHRRKGEWNFLDYSRLVVRLSSKLMEVTLSRVDNWHVKLSQGAGSEISHGD